VSSSEIAADWKNLTLYGNILAAIVAIVFLWIAADMQSFLETGIEGTWTWLTRAYGYPDVQSVMFAVNVTRGLAVCLWRAGRDLNPRPPT